MSKATCQDPGPPEQQATNHAAPMPLEEVSEQLDSDVTLEKPRRPTKALRVTLEHAGRGRPRALDTPSTER